MKKLLPAIVLIGVLLSSAACKKCSTCSFSEDGIDEKFTFAEGDLITVTSNSILQYSGITYLQGDTFIIKYDTASLNDGLQFQGTGTVMRTLRDTFCGQGNGYKEQLDQHTKNGWSCGDIDKKDTK